MNKKINNILLILFAALIIQNNFVFADTDPVLDINFDGTASDSSAYTHPIVTHGNPTFQNNAVTLNGINDYFEIPTTVPALSIFNTNQTNEMSFGFTIQSNNYNPTQVVISRRWALNADNDGQFNIFVLENRLYFSYYDDLHGTATFWPTRLLYTDRILNDGNAYNVVWVKKWNSLGTKLYVNGTEVCLRNYPQSNADYAGFDDSCHEVDFFPASTIPGNPVFIGADAAGDGQMTPQHFFNGTIDNLKVWNRALNPSEIQGSCSQEYSISNATSTLNFSGCRYGFIRSLVWNGSEQVSGVSNIGSILMQDGSSLTVSAINHLAGDQYQIQYDNSDIEMVMEIKPEPDDFSFKILSVTEQDPSDNSIGQIKDIHLFHFTPPHIPQSFWERDWALNQATATDFFPNALPLSPETQCTIYAFDYSCRVNSDLTNSFTDAAAALLVSSKADYENAHERLVLAHPSLPQAFLRRHQDSQTDWHRKSPRNRESYLFAQADPTNYQNLAKWAHHGRFRQFLAITPFFMGHYDRPNSFPDLNSFIQAMAYIQDYNQPDNPDPGNPVKVGIHTFLNQAHAVWPNPNQNDLVYFGAPPFSPHCPNNLADCLYSIPLGHLTSDLPAGAAPKTFALDIDLSQDEQFQFYWRAPIGIFNELRWFMVDNEIVTCSTYQNNELRNCLSNYTALSTHAAGAQVYMVPSDQFRTFFINPANQNLRDESIAHFQSMVNAFASQNVPLSMFYFDGSSFIPKPGMIWDIAFAFMDKSALPYINTFNSSDFPLIQGGGGSGSMGWYYADRVATDDGGIFNQKKNTESKAKGIAGNNPYDKYKFYEFGWWKFFGAHLVDGKWDFDASTFDDTHYAFTKSLALNAAVGLEMWGFYADLYRAFLDSLFDTIGIYHDLVQQDITPQPMKDYLKGLDHEAELNHTAGFNFVEKKVYRQYASWNDGGNFEYTIQNPFDIQKLHFEMRPRFDYLPFDSTTSDDIAALPTSTHFRISGFSSLRNPTNADVTMRAETSCSINNGTVTVTNYGTDPTQPGGCKIRIPIPTISATGLPQILNLTHKRGMGLSLTPMSTPNNEVVIVRLRHANFDLRDFRFLLDGNFQQGRADQVILGEATGDYQDIVNGINTNWEGYINKVRNWDFDYSMTDEVDIFVNNVAPGRTVTIQLNELKALQEKNPIQLVNPWIEVNGNRVTFPVTLSVDDTNANILEYNAYVGTYQLLTSNHAPVSSGQISNDSVVILQGSNTVRVGSDTSGNNGRRADVRIAVKNDSDGDGIPDSNTNFGISDQSCNGNTRNFCTDNCPGTPNSNQADSDGDGRGDACPNQYTLTMSATNGHVNLSPAGGSYIQDTLVELTPVPDSGYHFVRWEGDLTGSQNPAVLQMDSNKSVSAIFAVNPSQFSLTVSASNGSVALNPSGGTYDQGTTVTLTANPNSGFHFVRWEGDLTGSENPKTIVMDSNKSVTAIFGTTPPPVSNQPPTVNAGPDQSVAFPNSASLDGTVSDDGLPNPPASLTVTWSKVSGPGTVTFHNANQIDTTAGFSEVGIYILRLTATDSLLTSSDDIQVTVTQSGERGGGGDTNNPPGGNDNNFAGGGGGVVVVSNNQSQSNAPTPSSLSNIQSSNGDGKASPASGPAALIVKPSFEEDLTQELAGDEPFSDPDQMKKHLGLDPMSKMKKAETPKATLPKKENKPTQPIKKTQAKETQLPKVSFEKIRSFGPIHIYKALLANPSGHIPVKQWKITGVPSLQGFYISKTGMLFYLNLPWKKEQNLHLSVKATPVNNKTALVTQEIVIPS